MAYAVRMMPKQGYTPDGYFEYTVYPLEGIWDLTEEGKKLDTLNKDELLYTIMIRQPDFVTKEIVERAFENVEKKKPHPFLNDVKFDTFHDGLSVQMLHVGPYDDEPQSFKLMNEFIKNNNLERTSLQHREIYLSDFRKVEPAKLKTVLRYKVKAIE
ncbi:GyrI-like domain-containing protein [Peribacillus simplex]|uniref:GyrI-like domain-containing protein n=1 Tax=Peribacillus simplex TaxID=1478 RepID=UPI0024C15F97|nr:GyrI-like domain-containing protein [Peribacillus simplex]WHY99408.1 GyrI-like domain-containing protein [Peribacillus simplex]